jgi:hypothetical protein
MAFPHRCEFSLGQGTTGWMGDEVAVRLSTVPEPQTPAPQSLGFYKIIQRR